VHGRLRPDIAENPVDVCGGGETARAARIVANLQDRELDRSVDRDIDPHLGAYVGFHMFEDAVAESMTADIGGNAAHGRGRGRPVLARLFVAKVTRFAAGVGDGIVIPRSEAILLRVAGPRAGATTFRY